jgi:hypothetical protein
VPFVNFADKQFSVVDSGQVAQDLVGVPFFSTLANYNAGQPVVFSGRLYIALVSVTAGAWNPAQWAAAITANAIPGVYPQDGIQVNGGFEVSQQLGVGNPVNTGYFCDQWTLFRSPGAGSLAQIQAAPGVYSGLPYHGVATVTVASPTLNPTDFCLMNQPIEGMRAARLGFGYASASAVTVCFWSNHFRTGLYSVALRNAANNRSCVMTYTHAASGVAQYNVLTFPGDVTGSWAIDTSVGLQLSFVQAAGTSFNAPATGTWYAANYCAVAGQVNGLTSTSDYFRITGVQVLPGNQGPPASQSAYTLRTPDVELRECQRYYEQLTSGIGNGSAVSGTTFIWIGRYQPKRVNPTVTFFTPTSMNVWNASGSGIFLTSASLSSSSNNGFVANGTVASGLVAGNGISVAATGVACIVVDARL